MNRVFVAERFVCANVLPEHNTTPDVVEADHLHFVLQYITVEQA